jgi:uncharacterized membrane protein
MVGGYPVIVVSPHFIIIIILIIIIIIVIVIDAGSQTKYAYDKHAAATPLHQNQTRRYHPCVKVTMSSNETPGLDLSLH